MAGWSVDEEARHAHDRSPPAGEGRAVRRVRDDRSRARLRAAVEIIELLAQGERTVEQIADAIGQSVANTSHHMRTLARAGLSPAGAPPTTARGRAGPVTRV